MIALCGVWTHASEDTATWTQRINHSAKNARFLTGRIRTIDLGITKRSHYSPPLYQLSYGELKNGAKRELNPRPLVPETRIIPLDH